MLERLWNIKFFREAFLQNSWLPIHLIGAAILSWMFSPYKYLLSVTIIMSMAFIVEIIEAIEFFDFTEWRFNQIEITWTYGSVSRYVNDISGDIIGVLIIALFCC